MGCDLLYEFVIGPVASKIRYVKINPFSKAPIPGPCRGSYRSFSEENHDSAGASVPPILRHRWYNRAMCQKLSEKARSDWVSWLAARSSHENVCPTTMTKCVREEVLKEAKDPSGAATCNLFPLCRLLWPSIVAIKKNTRMYSYLKFWRRQLMIFLCTQYPYIFMLHRCLWPYIYIHIIDYNGISIEPCVPNQILENPLCD